MPDTSIENEATVISSSLDPATIHFPVWHEGGTPEDAKVSLAVVKACQDAVYTITDGPSVDINPINGAIQVWTLGANQTPTATSFAAGQSVTLMIADGASAYSVVWSSVGVVWVGGSAPTLPTSGYAVVVLWKVGSTIYGTKVGDVA